MKIERFGQKKKKIERQNGAGQQIIHFCCAFPISAVLFLCARVFVLSFQMLYIKNLSARVGESDLLSLFLRFQKPSKPKIVFKLMTGRMKGQAFVTFQGIVDFVLIGVLLHIILLESVHFIHCKCKEIFYKFLVLFLRYTKLPPTSSYYTPDLS